MATTDFLDKAYEELINMTDEEVLIRMAEVILREECLKETNGVHYEHNVTHKGIIRAMLKFRETRKKTWKESFQDLLGKYYFSIVIVLFAFYGFYKLIF